ncbi:hypothetical protein OIE66_42320 [Nonomuraea sp. NBC_01738]|uniref:hypothetical protein n=1 Tax=Nonomuraea sp. NBC_01738 TaxID=2976003 RepID=UPI002E10DCBE|nr:hypothetical protein OIE66_42320 [Nonomuraea sp. NBC_01738]
MRIKKLALIAAIAMAGSVAPATAAFADPPPSSCSVDVYTSTDIVWAHCKTGTGYVRAHAKCKKGSSTKWVSGTWEPTSPGWAFVGCPTGWDVIAGDYSVKGY